MMKKGKLGKFLALICSLMAGVMIFSLAACNDTDDSGKELKLDKTTVSVEEGATATVNVTSSTTETIEWTVDKPDVATVVGSGSGNKLGTITGVAEGTATVTAKAGDKTATCAVTVTKADDNNGGDDEENPPIVEPTEIAYDTGTPEGWSYWAGDSDANLSEKNVYGTGVNAEVRITYTATYGAPWALQLRYNDKYTGVIHDAALTIVSPVAATILVNGEEKQLIVGDNAIEVKGYSAQTLFIQFGTGTGWDDSKFITGENLAFVIKDIVITSNAEELSVPSFSYDDTAKTVAITDTNDTAKVGSYQLGFFESASATSPKATLTVANGGVVDVKTVSNGDYVVRIRAIGVDANFISSAWSTNSVELTVNNDTTAITANTTEGWYYDTTGNSGLDNAYLDSEGTIHIEGLAQGAFPYAFQLKKNLTTAITSITMTVHAEQDGYLAFGNPAGSVQEQQIAANVDVQVTLTGLNITGTLVICFGNNVSWWANQGSDPAFLSGNITISNIVLA